MFIDTVKIYLLKIDTRIFDYKYNVKTHKDLNINDLKFNSINKKEPFNYETLAISSIKQILNNIVGIYNSKSKFITVNYAEKKKYF